MELKELPLDGKFCSSTVEEPRSVIHQEALRRNRNMLSKSPIVSLQDYILPPQEAPSEEYMVASPPRSFMSLVKAIIRAPTIRPEPPPFKFDTNEASLEFNRKVLETFDFDLEKLIPAFKNNVISPGSEFRDPMLLAPLLQSHQY